MRVRDPSNRKLFERAARANPKHRCASSSTCTECAPFERQQLHIVLKRVLAHFIRADAHAAPRVICLRGLVESVDLASQQSAGLQHTSCLAQILHHDITARDVLEDGVRVHQVEESSAKGARSAPLVACGCACGTSRRFCRARAIISSDTSTPWISPKWRDIGFINRPGPQPISSARHARRLALAGKRRSSHSRPVTTSRAVSKNSFFVLLTAAERDVEVGVFASPLIPIVPHAFGYVYWFLHTFSSIVLLFKSTPGAAAIQRSAILKPEMILPLIIFSRDKSGLSAALPR